MTPTVERSNVRESKTYSAPEIDFSVVLRSNRGTCRPHDGLNQRLVLWQSGK